MTVFDGLFTPESLSQTGDVLVKLGIGAILGMAIGWERELHGRPAGIRTHMLMVIGVVLFAEVSKAFVANDHSRIAAQIVTGVGFLGAGTIMRSGPEIKGLTTAASIWAAAGIGMAISAGGFLLVVAVAATVLVLITLALVDDFWRWVQPRKIKHKLVVRLANREAVGALLRKLQDAAEKFDQVRIVEEGDELMAYVDVDGDEAKIGAEVCTIPGVLSADWSG